MRLVSAAAFVPAFFQTCLPNPPQIEPPVAHIEFACVTADCLVMELSAENSIDADDYDWTIDGVGYGTDEVIAIDVPERGLLEIDLTVTNPAGADTTRRHVLATPVYPVPQDPDPGFDPSTALVIVGAQACDASVVISTVGGCFTGPAPLDHVVKRDRFGMIGRSVLSYDPVLNDLDTPGYAVAARWRNNHDRSTYPNHSTTTYYYNSSPSDYGPPPARLVNLHGAGTTDHITSYYPIATGDILEFEFTHGVYLGDPALQPLDALRLDCSSGSPIVASEPLYAPVTGG